MLIGHSKQLNYLQKVIDSGKPPHGWLFVGPDGIGKKKIALAFAKALQRGEKMRFEDDGEINPDIFTVEKEEDNKEIKIGQIRELKSYLSFSAYREKFKTAVIADAHFLNKSAQNALLKTLEEPKGGAVIILTVSNKDFLLETVVSRLQLIDFDFVGTKEIFDFLKSQKEFTGKTEKEIRAAATYCFGRPDDALKLLKDDKKLKKRIELQKDLHNLLVCGIVGRYKYAQRLVKDKNWEKEKNDFFNALLFLTRNIFLIKSGCEDLAENWNCAEVTAYAKERDIEKIAATINLILKISLLTRTINVNNRLAVERIMLEL